MRATAAKMEERVAGQAQETTGTQLGRLKRLRSQSQSRTYIERGGDINEIIRPHRGQRVKSWRRWYAEVQFPEREVNGIITITTEEVTEGDGTSCKENENSQEGSVKRQD